MRFSKMDVCEAYYVFASEYHCGQGCRWYKVLSRLHKLGFKPREIYRGYDTSTAYGSLTRAELTDNGQDIYDLLVEKYFRG